MKSRIVVPALVGAAAASLAATPPPAAAQGGLLGVVGGVVGGTTSAITDTLDQLLGGTDAVLPTDTLGDVLDTVAGPGAPGGAGGAGGSVQVVGSSGGAPGAAGGVGAAGGAGGPASTVMPSADDRRAPLATVKIVSRLARVARTRRLRVEVRSDEAGVVAFSSTVRPGLLRRGARVRGRHSRSVIHVPPVVLAFRQPGALTVDLRLSASDAARLGRARNGRMSVGLLTADVARNQATERLKRHLAR